MFRVRWVQYFRPLYGVIFPYHKNPLSLAFTKMSQIVIKNWRNTLYGIKYLVQGNNQINALGILDSMQETVVVTDNVLVRLLLSTSNRWLFNRENLSVHQQFWLQQNISVQPLNTMPQVCGWRMQPVPPSTFVFENYKIMMVYTKISLWYVCIFPLDGYTPESSKEKNAKM